MTEAQKLHVFHDGQDWFIAADAMDAAAVRAELYPHEAPEDFDALAQIPEDEVIGVLCNEQGKPDDHGVGVNKTAAEWAAQEGRGVLCSRDD